MHSATQVIELCDFYVDFMIYSLIDQLIHHLSTDYMYHQQNVSFLLTLLCESLNLLNHHFWMYVFVDLDECSHLFLLYVLKHFFNFNLMYHYFKTDFMQTCIQQYLFDSKIVFLQCSFAILCLDLKYDWQRDLSVQDADYESSASYACQKSWTISSTLTEQ